RFVTPDKGRQRTFPLDELAGPPGIVDDRLDLAAVADDPLVPEQTPDIAPGEACYPVEIEIMKGGTEILPFREDGGAAQSGLKALQTQFLEQAPIAVDGKAPLGIVIGQKLGSGRAPFAAWPPVGSRYRAHVSALPMASNEFHQQRRRSAN